MTAAPVAGSRRAPSAREVALLVTRDVFGDRPRGAREALAYRLNHASLDARDRAFATELAYGAIKMRRLLDWYLAPYLGDRAKTIPTTIREILRLGTHQLRVMNGVEAYAAVSESVGLAKRYGHRGTANLVNAVLRRVSDAPDRAPQRDEFESDDDFLATIASLPTWIVAHWRRRFGDDAIQAIVAGVDAPAPVGLRVNLWRASVDDVLHALPAPAHRSLVARESIVLDESLSGVELEARADSTYGVQAEAACFPVDILDPSPGEFVVEFCSGRGNKSQQLVGRMHNSGRVQSIESDERKAKRAREVLAQTGATCVEVLVGDATLPVDGDDGATLADRVIVDAPCSGLGILGRQPEARWRKAPPESDRLAIVQRALVDRAADRVRQGGRLVYAVCTSDARECENVIDGLLERRVDFARVPLPERYTPWVTAAGDVLVPPGIGGRDGFYIASLVRS